MTRTVVGLLTLELHLEGARSLKAKRAVLRSVRDRLLRSNVSVAEVGHQDLWQRAELAVTAVGSSRLTVEHTLEQVIETVERKDAGLIVQSDLEWLT